MLRRLLMVAGGVMATAAAAVFVWSKRRAELDAAAARATGRAGRGGRGRRGAGRGDRGPGVRASDPGGRQDIGLTPLPPERGGGSAATEAAGGPDRLGEPAAAEGEAGDGDDLRTVKGIGRVSAERLRAMGIVRLAQIAAWSEADVDAVAQDVGISAERIRREDWVGQARALVEAAP